MAQVVVLEDESAIRELLRMMLTGQGYQCLDFGTSASLLSWWLRRERNPDVYLFDVMLPDLNGFQVTRLIRATDQSTPILLLTAKSEGQSYAQARASGADRYLTKPFSTAELLAELDVAIKRGRVPKQESADGRFEDPGDAKLALTGGLPRLYSAIGELVGSYCHDISNALAVSAGYLDLARNGLGGDRALETAAQGNVAAIERIRMLHGFVRTLYRQSTDAADLIGQAEIPSMVQEMFDNTFVQGQLHVSTAGLATEQLPKVLLGALLYPPLHNSAEATGDRERRGVAVTLGLNDQRSALQVLIEDDGPGWPKKPDVILRSIVADQPFSTKGQGRGNGLRNVYRLVSTLGGGLQIGRSSGGGATVDIRVPLRGLTNVN